MKEKVLYAVQSLRLMNDCFYDNNTHLHKVLHDDNYRVKTCKQFMLKINACWIYFLYWFFSLCFCCFKCATISSEEERKKIFKSPLLSVFSSDKNSCLDLNIKLFLLASFLSSNSRFIYFVIISTFLQWQQQNVFLLTRLVPSLSKLSANEFDTIIFVIFISVPTMFFYTFFFF